MQTPLRVAVSAPEKLVPPEYPVTSIFRPEHILMIALDL